MAAHWLGTLCLLDVVDGGEDFKWRLFGGRHVEEFGADLTNVAISSLIAEHPAATGLRDVMRAVVERRGPVPFEIHYMSANKLLREAVGTLMPLTDENGDIAYLSRRGGLGAGKAASRLIVTPKTHARLARWRAKTGIFRKIQESGAQRRIRTTDTAIFSRMLYQLSYLGPLRRWGTSGPKEMVE